MTVDNRPWAEIIFEKHLDWCDKDNAARLLEDTKSAVFSQRCKALGDMTVARSEQIVRASPDWYDHVIKIVQARTAANIARANLEYARVKKDEAMNADANHRAEARL